MCCLHSASELVVNERGSIGWTDDEEGIDCLNREHIGDTRLLKEPSVWQALIGVGMPFTTLTRNLGCLTSLGMFDDSAAGTANLAAATKRFTDEASLKVRSSAARSWPVFALHFEGTSNVTCNDKWEQPAFFISQISWMCVCYNVLLQALASPTFEVERPTS